MSLVLSIGIGAIAVIGIVLVAVGAK